MLKSRSKTEDGLLVSCSSARRVCRIIKTQQAQRSRKTSLSRIQHYKTKSRRHIADPDKAIDALGDAAADYDRDGLCAVAHLCGKSGMKKFVQSKGD